MLKHKSIHVTIGSGQMAVDRGAVSMNSSDVALSYLPSAHAFNSVFTNWMFASGNSQNHHKTALYLQSVYCIDDVSRCRCGLLQWVCAEVDG